MRNGRFVCNQCGQDRIPGLFQPWGSVSGAGKSSVTCEDCGKLGKANDSGWIRTQCDACRNRIKESD